MPAPAVIPALRVYTNTAVVKSFVVHMSRSHISGSCSLKFDLPPGMEEWPSCQRVHFTHKRSSDLAGSVYVVE